MGTKNCPRCKTTKPVEEFYVRHRDKKPSAYCKICTNNQTTERQRALKAKAVEYLGGQCVYCGYHRYQGALEPHHLDPTQKEFSLAHYKLYTFNNKIKAELNKCVLLCSNCHKEIHAGVLRLG